MGYIRDHTGDPMGVIKADTRSLDYGSYRFFFVRYSADIAQERGIAWKRKGACNANWGYIRDCVDEYCPTVWGFGWMEESLTTSGPQTTVIPRTEVGMQQGDRQPFPGMDLK